MAKAKHSRRHRIYYDATLLLRSVSATPVGLTRVEQYVAEYIISDKELNVHFVVVDPHLCAYRSCSQAESEILHNFLLGRYASSGKSGQQVREAASWHGDHPPVETAPFVERALDAVRLTPDAFANRISAFLLESLPIRPDRNAFSRASRRLVRAVVATTARTGHHGARLTLSAGRAARHRALGITQPDRRGSEPQTSESEGIDEALSQQDGRLKFAKGDVLICLANLWDYMDYRYLAEICQKDGVKFICVIYDVIAVELPHTTPGPPHVYHRHWVEVGHVAHRLICISAHVKRKYTELIAAPNDLAPSLTHALLPNFLAERAAEIGEQPVRALMGKTFVVYCSTIETRKNHQVLLQAWDAMRQDIGIDALPVLVLVGKWGWGTEAVRLLVERNWRLRPKLLVLDVVSDAALIWLYRHARFSVFPALAEGFGLGAAESLAFGTPVVISTCPALAEATEGLMPAIPPLDFMGWARELTRLVTDDAYLAELRGRAANFHGAAYDTFAKEIKRAAVSPSVAA